MVMRGNLNTDLGKGMIVCKRKYMYISGSVSPSASLHFLQLHQKRRKKHPLKL